MFKQCKASGEEKRGEYSMKENILTAEERKRRKIFREGNCLVKGRRRRMKKEKGGNIQKKIIIGREKYQGKGKEENIQRGKIHGGQEKEEVWRNKRRKIFREGRHLEEKNIETAEEKQKEQNIRRG